MKTQMSSGVSSSALRLSTVNKHVDDVIGTWFMKTQMSSGVSSSVLKLATVNKHDDVTLVWQQTYHTASASLTPAYVCVF